MKTKMLTLFTLVAAQVVYSQHCKLINKITIQASNTVEVQYLDVSRLNNNGLDELTAIDINKWHYVAVTKATSGIGVIYIDGKKVVESTWEDVSYDYTTIKLGARDFSGWYDYFKGYIDELKVSNVIKKEQEIKNAYTLNTAFSTDANTVELWHFDNTTGSSSIGENGGSMALSNGAMLVGGKFGNAIYFDGIDDRASTTTNIPENDITVEFWFKPDGYQSNSMLVELHGKFNSGIKTLSATKQVELTWFNGAKTNSIDIDPFVDSVVWVSNGICTDTLYLGTKVKHDTIRTTVTDTLIIEGITGLNENIENRIAIYPNPAKDYINLDFQNSANLSGYSINIMNSQSVIVHSEDIDNSYMSIELSSLGNAGLYFIQILNSNNEIVEIRKLVVR